MWNPFKRTFRVTVREGSEGFYYFGQQREWFLFFYDWETVTGACDTPEEAWDKIDEYVKRKQHIRQKEYEMHSDKRSF